ncbi:MAG: type II secretion system protein [Candidatus Shapirobacteria bacterium]
MKHTICLPKKKGFTLIELLVVIGILALLLAITLIAINPAKQFMQANDTKRSSDVNAILNALNQYAADHKGQLPAGIGASAVSIGSSGGVDLCASLVTEYLAALPTDPTIGSANAVVGAPVTVCTQAYDTGYSISRSASNNRLTVTATSEVNPAVPIQVTR